MTKLNRKVEYSLMALKHMSRKTGGELTTAKEVAESYAAPFDATARVMQMMAGHGLLKSEQGATGGYQIARDLSNVNLHELIEVIQGPTQIAKCLHHGPGQLPEPCEIQKSCNIMSPVTNLNKRLNEFYKGVSLRELLSEGSKND